MNTVHDDPLNDLFNAAGNVVAFAPPPRRGSPPATYTAPTYTEPCGKCRGSGLWNGRPGYPCFSCKGTGSKSFKTSREQRASNATSAANRRARTEAENVEQWKTTFPDVHAWMVANPGFEFAVSLLAAVGKYGDLTERQMVGARKCMAASAAREERKAAQVEERAQVVAQAPVIDATAIAQALQRALDRTGKRPKLFIGDCRFQFAPTDGRNAGSIYVTNRAKTYLGRITEGKFVASRNCDSGTEIAIVEIAKDPRAAAIAHGFRTGNCACCGRLLTDPVSVANGIGPICAQGFGW